MSERSTLRLSDGRELDIEISGPAEGMPVIWHHGTPGCAVQDGTKIKATAERGMRLVTYSRAGARNSTRKPGRSVADVASDMRELLDHLGAERCIVGGESGGGPHALATAALLPDRVAACIVVCGVKPYGPGFLDGMGEDNLVEFGLALDDHAGLESFLRTEREGLISADADTVIASMESLLPQPDRDVIREAGDDLLALLAGGVESIWGWYDDDLAFVRPWGFELEDITVPTYFWQGTEDLMVPQSHMPWQAERVPGSVMHLRDGEGHISLIVRCFDEMLAEAVGHL